MKKMMAGILVAGLLLFGFAGQSLAAFATGDLIRIVYSPGGQYEYATDLGSLTGLQGSATTTAALIANSGFTTYAGSSYSSLDVTYWVYVGGSNTSLDIASATSNTAPVVQAALPSGWMQQISSTTYYDKSTNHVSSSVSTVPGYTAQLSQTLATGAGSYVYKLDGNGTGYPGSYDNSLTTDVESNLGALANSGGSVAMYLYNFNINTSGAGTLVIDSGSNNIFEIITTANGTEIEEVQQPSSVPIPPSMLLLAPGLLGLIGLRRRKAA